MAGSSPNTGPLCFSVAPNPLLRPGQGYLDFPSVPSQLMPDLDMQVLASLHPTSHPHGPLSHPPTPFLIQHFPYSSPPSTYNPFPLPLHPVSGTFFPLLNSLGITGKGFRVRGSGSAQPLPFSGWEMFNVFKPEIHHQYSRVYLSRKVRIK